MIMDTNGYSESPLNILDLPEELALHIFSYFSPTQLCDNVAPVCTLWARYCTAPQLWKHKVYSINSLRTVDQHKSVLEKAPVLHQLRLEEGSNVECLLPMLLTNCSCVKDLVICGKSINYEIFSHIVRKYQRSLCSLTLEGLELDTSWYSAISCLAKGLKSLTINADCCIWALGLLAVECPSLTVLRLTSCILTEDHRRQTNSVKPLLLLLPDSLEVLQLGAYITPNAEIFEAIGKKARLHSLTVEDCCEMWDEDLVHVLSLQSLTNLQLWRAHRVSADGLYRFIHYSNYIRLKHLDLFDCRNLNDEVLQEISIRCPQLDVLDVSHCYLLTDHGISCVFQMCSNLHTLRMSHLPQPTGRDYLKHLPELLPKLIYLDAYNCFNIPCQVLKCLESRKLIVMFGKEY